MRIDRPQLLDAALAAVLAVGSGVALAYSGSPLPVTLLTVLACLPVAVRRRWPLGAFTANIVLGLLLAALGQDPGTTGTATLILLYTAAAYRGLAVALGALLLSFVAYTLNAAISLPDQVTLSDHVIVVIVLAAVWGTGRSLRLRRAYLDELKDRATRLERARDADTRAAKAEERARIARELHDVVAHHVSVMTVQAAAARKVLASDPALADEALSAIENTGRMAMNEMRNMVGVLRTDGGYPAERGPQPGMHDLPALVEQMREAGLSARLSVEGVPGAIPAGVDLAAYRLVQEGLTNTLRHAGAGAAAVVTVRHEPRELDVRVEDDGRVPSQAQQTGKDRVGHGLVGIRERVALYGGILKAGPRPGGGFEVQARFPLKDGQ
ncbi:sensor histidine kinase [Nonomuraea sp. NPDC050556]|uniref:sensor histidine kinase n=1 Tax=Nonomuraea sp. NPDC050556 TaxID=3364369 RepID=UPI0037ADB487